MFLIWLGWEGEGQYKHMILRGGGGEGGAKKGNKDYYVLQTLKETDCMGFGWIQLTSVKRSVKWLNPWPNKQSPATQK
jgi:hypothetical protein